MMEGKNIVLGITGSIAAYKAVLIARSLVESGADVWPILTPSATRFVGALTFSSLTGHRAIVDLWSQAEAGEIGHVETAHRADLVLVAPCTADFLARLAVGRADDPLSAMCLSTQAPILVAPAMETGMWKNAATQANVTTLINRGVQIVPPGTGTLASGREGEGRLAAPDTIVESAAHLFAPHQLAGKKVLVTAGPTREYFDPVRFIANPSSGKMGYALARMAARRGAKVYLVSGPTHLPAPPNVERLSVQTTQEMLTACERKIDDVDALIMAAAPSDYKPASFSPAKLKKENQPDSLQVSLAATPDILLHLQPRLRNCVVVGFAAESNHVATNAKAKLHAKSLDLIVANDITHPQAGFGVDTNAVTILARNGDAQEFPVESKDKVAERIIDRVVDLLVPQAASDGESGSPKA